MKSVPAKSPRLARASPRFEYRRLDRSEDLEDDVLFAVGFGAATAVGSRRVRIALEALTGADLTEVWLANGTVISGQAGAVRFSHDDHFLAGVIEVDERHHGGIGAAAADAYRAIAAFQSSSAFPHLLRTWNYFAAINDGAGEHERYRGFCAGRVAGLAEMSQLQHPAATVIGTHGDAGILQVYWLAAREPGVALENPRQVSAYRYPRQYGETSPTFSRAMLVTPHVLMISGTASIVGHSSLHRDDARAQVREILVNLDSLLERARQQSSSLPARFGNGALVKAYVRRSQDQAIVSEVLDERLPAEAPRLVLHGDVCRSELLVELDCVVYAGG